MKWYWKIFMTVVALLLIGYFSIDHIAKSIVEKEVLKLKQQLSSQYNFDYKSLELSLVNRWVVLNNFVLSTVIDSTKKEKNKYDVKLDKLLVKYATYRDIFFNRSLDVAKIVLEEPEISFGLKSYKKTEQDKEEIKEEPDSLENSFFEKMTLANVIIESGKVDIYNLEDPDTKLLFVNDLDVNINGFVVDLLKDSFYFIPGNTEKPFFSFKEVYKNDLKNHNLSIDEIQYFADTKKLSITNFLFENRESPVVFARSLSHRSPWFSIKVPSIELILNPREIYDTGDLHLPVIEIADAEVTINNDLNLPIKPGHKPMPGSSIKSIKQNLLIDSIQIKNARLNYIHRTVAADPGLFKLTNINAQVLRVTDIDSLIAINPFMDLKVNAVLWDEGDLNVDFRIDLSSTSDRIDVNGSLKNMSFEKVENMTKPLYGVEVLSGRIDLLGFNFAMDENKSIGSIVFNYRDLKVDIKAQEKDQKEENDKKEYSDKSIGILNFAASQVIWSDNQPNDENYIPKGSIIVDRTKIKPVFDLLWNSLAVGMMDIAVKDALYDSEKSYKKRLRKAEKAAKKQNKNPSN